MKFVAHNHYHNNNIRYLYQGEGARNVAGGGNVYISSDGIAILSLSERWDEADKRNMLAALDHALRERYGNGLSAATHAVSDCTGSADFNGFFAAAKETGADIKTIYFSYFPSNRINADITSRFEVREALLEAVKPGDADREEPAQGWWQYGDELNDLVESVYQGVRKKPAPVAAAGTALPPVTRDM